MAACPDQIGSHLLIMEEQPPGFVPIKDLTASDVAGLVKEFGNADIFADVAREIVQVLFPDLRQAPSSQADSLSSSPLRSAASMANSSHARTPTWTSS